MPPIPEHIIDRIRDSVNIVDVIGRYVTLKKRGRNYVGLCPFHTEKTPSFTVNAEKQIFHCFGCGTGGNVYTFLMRHDNLSFVEAVRRLADETGIKIPVSRETRRKEGENEQLFKANQIALNFFRQRLQQSPRVQQYLQQRGITRKTIEHFKLGFAPDEWDGLLKHIRRFGYSEKPYEKVGLFTTSEKSGNLYDRFRNRLIFPIFNTSGKVVGFGGRTLSDDPQTPKYINSPESPIYHKGRVLYGLNFAAEAIREAGLVIVVEGYMDLLQLHQQGVGNVVATSGTALTEDHARLIRRYTRRVVLCYDADNAGIQAAARGGEVLFQHLLETQVLILPPGEDPDSFVKQHGGDAFRKLVTQAQDYLTFRLDLLERAHDLQQAAERSRAIQEVLDLLLPVPDSVQVNFYLEKVAERWQLPIAMLLNEFKKKHRARRQRQRYGEAPPPPPEAAPKAPAGDAPLMFSGAWGAEKDVILLLLNAHDQVREQVYDLLGEEDFRNPEFRELFRLIGALEVPDAPHLLHA
ncbi:MAG: DNA primase, partial [Calditrichaeota bacterium]